MAQLTLRYGFPGGIWLSQSLKRDWTLSEKGDLKYERDMRGFLLLLKIGGHMASDCGWLAHKNCFRAEYNPSWHSARRGSPHSYSCKELNSPNLNEIGSGILYLPGQTSQPGQCIDFSDTPSRESSHAIPRLLIYRTKSWWIGVVTSHQVCGHLLHGNKKLRYTPGVCRQPLLHPDHISARAEVKMLHLS